MELLIPIAFFGSLILIPIVALYQSKQKKNNDAVVSAAISSCGNTVDEEVSYLQKITGRKTSALVEQHAFGKALAILKKSSDEEQVAECFAAYLSANFETPESKQWCTNRFFPPCQAQMHN